MKPSVAIVAGARPNFMKIAPVLRAIDQLKPDFSAVVVHTGQHYSPELSDVFFEQLGIRPPDAHLEAGSGTHGQQTAKILESFETWLMKTESRPAAVMVAGDVNSTIAAALAATKLGIPVVHLEAGLRSFDRRMPEEINRLATDAISDLLLVSEPSGEANLRHEGVPDSRIRYVGNVMIDTLVHHLDAVRAANPASDGPPHALVTLHRPSNVDSPAALGAVCDFLCQVASHLRVIFPVHPRTQSRLAEHGLDRKLEAAGIILLPPQGYLENLRLMSTAKLVLTDSGGIQEETSFLSIPCLTLRENTERPSTLSLGTNTLIGFDFAAGLRHVDEILGGTYRKSTGIPGWDGNAALRVVRELASLLGVRECSTAVA